MTEPDRDIETLIDAKGLAETLQQIAEVCFAKSEHIHSNWQDHKLGNKWMVAGRMVRDLTDKVMIQELT